MYFSGTIKVDPSEAVKIQTVKPEGFGSKVLAVLQRKKNNRAIETETFTAVSILQQIYKVLKSLDIRNVVSLKTDDFVFYEDSEGNDDDLDEVVMKYELENDDLVDAEFNQLILTLEHTAPPITYLIKLLVTRRHEHGVYPMVIRIKGLVDDGELSAGSGNQESVKAVLNKAGEAFIHFLNRIDFYVRKTMAVDDIRTEHDVGLVINREDVSQFEKRTGTKHTLQSYFIQEMNNAIQNMSLNFDLDSMLKRDMQDGLFSKPGMKTVKEDEEVQKQHRVKRKPVIYTAKNGDTSCKIFLLGDEGSHDEDSNEAIVVPFEVEQ
jgi:hypothetical protein